MRLPRKEFSIIVDSLSKLGYVVEGSRIPYAFGVAALVTIAWSDLDKIFLIHVPKRLVDKNDDVALGGLEALRLLAREARRVFLFSRKVNSSSGLFDIRTETWRNEDVYVTFVGWRNVVQLGLSSDPQYDLKLLLRLPERDPRPKLPSVADTEDAPPATAVRARVPEARAPLEISRRHIDYVVDVLVHILRGLDERGHGFFNGLIYNLDLPGDWALNVENIWTGDVLKDSRRLVKFAQSKNYYPPDHDYRDSQVLGRLIEQLYTQIGDGHMEQRFLEILSTYALLPPETIKKFPRRLQG